MGHHFVFLSQEDVSCKTMFRSKSLRSESLLKVMTSEYFRSMHYKIWFTLWAITEYEKVIIPKMGRKSGSQLQASFDDDHDLKGKHTFIHANMRSSKARVQPKLPGKQQSRKLRNVCFRSLCL